MTLFFYCCQPRNKSNFAPEHRPKKGALNVGSGRNLLQYFFWGPNIHEFFRGNFTNAGTRDDGSRFELPLRELRSFRSTLRQSKGASSESPRFLHCRCTSYWSKGDFQSAILEYRSGSLKNRTGFFPIIAYTIKIQSRLVAGCPQNGSPNGKLPPWFHPEASLLVRHW